MSTVLLALSSLFHAVIRAIFVNREAVDVSRNFEGIREQLDARRRGEVKKRKSKKRVVHVVKFHARSQRGLSTGCRETNDPLL